MLSRSIRDIHSGQRDLGLGRVETRDLGAYELPPDRKFPMARLLHRQVPARRVAWDHGLLGTAGYLGPRVTWDRGLLGTWIRRQ